MLILGVMFRILLNIGVKLKLKSIEIQNFKCFESLSLKFEEQFNVIIGDNATGKTSILDAISFALGTFFIGARKATNDSRIEFRPLKNNEKRRVLTDSSINFKLPFKITLEHYLNNDIYKWSRSTDKVSGGSTTYIDASRFIDKACEICSGMFDEKDKTSLPLIAYYGTERLFNERGQRKPGLKITARTEGYYGALDPRSLEERFISWFSLEEDKILKFDKDPEHYDAFVEAITTMVPDWNDIRFSWPHETILGLMKSGEWVSFDMMSSGYKSIVRLAGDIAYRAIKLNPHLGRNAVKMTHGVALIDELDMHLHPIWQKDLVGLLKLTFPNIQFITTTHSPFVIQSLRGSEVIKIADHLPKSISGNVHLKGLEDIVEEEMGVENPRRSKQYELYFQLATEYFSLIKNNHGEESLSGLKERLDEIELYFNDDPVLTALLKLERKIGESK